MRKPTGIESLYIDFDAFFANAEKLLVPALRDRPVGVVPLPSEHTSLIACCYQSRLSGVKRGMSVAEARSACPDIALVLARHDEYVRLHHRILEEINRHLPVRRVWSIDEMECDLLGSEQQRGLQIARQVRDGLAENIGPLLTPSIGLGPNQFLAKVAAEMEKPAGLTLLHPETLPEQILHLPLTDLPGISSRMLARLHVAGITSMAGLWATSPKQARHIWRSVEGERLWLQLHGYAVSRPETVRRMFGHGRVLARGWQTPSKARECLRLLTAKAAQRLRREGYTASAADISLKTSDGTYWSGTQSFAPSRDDRTFLQAASILFDLGAEKLKGARFQNIYVMLHGLRRPGETSGDLFEHGASHTDRQRWERITDTMDSLNTRYGGGIISLGIRTELPGGYAGAKIAFGRVPDLKDFDAPARPHTKRVPHPES
ncbi:MAG: type VI secretion protein ImpB [Alphaproteobacteria bacterium HGW-Alphaproteobacteria-18]|nr:MAG: type VI secretion protein ImpB [Alphaproteobacteria bacterium HGW-Alphaproteobacteria-18]